MILAGNLYRISAQTAATGVQDERNVGRLTKDVRMHKHQGWWWAPAGLTGSQERVVVGIVGLAHVPGIVANWGHQVDCSKKIGGLLHPKCRLPWQKQAVLAVAMVSVATTMFAANTWMKNYRDATLARSVASKSSSGVAVSGQP